ncbi:hypothetical protein DSO57_1031112 [Entomophthora muscae]|uniref:Uncharacterized protein n=1 Tax=Entomophthora muscae TaxID=34485 RepID=A0ACC2RRN3_9FUNG|nr:hypothetical protein DSO57_1031112 [Entomophthora muscae]
MNNRNHLDKRGVKMQVERACDGCHEKKLRCRQLGGGECERCKRLGHECLFTKPLMKRGRRKKVFNDFPFPASQVEELENLVVSERETQCEQLFDEQTSQLDSLEEHLIVLYFRYVQPFYPLVIKDVFLKQCHSEMDDAWTMLLCTLCCAACPFLSMEPFDSENCSKQLTTHYHEMALDLLDVSTSQPSLIGLQALLVLLTIEQTNKARFTKMAFEMAEVLDLASHVNPEQKAENSLVLSACHMLDCHWSLVQNKQAFFDGPPPPITDFSSSTANAIFMQCTSNDGIASIAPELSLLFHHQYSKLAPIMKHISVTLQLPLTMTCFSGEHAAQFQAKALEANLLSSILHQWLQDAIDALSQPAWGEAGAILKTLLRIYHHTLTIHVFLPFAFFQANCFPLGDDYVSICLHAAHDIVTLAASLGDYFVIYGHHFRNHARLFAWIIFHLFDPSAHDAKAKLIQMAKCRLYFKSYITITHQELESHYLDYSLSILRNLGADHLRLDNPLINHDLSQHEQFRLT